MSLASAPKPIELQIKDYYGYEVLDKWMNRLYGVAEPEIVPEVPKKLFTKEDFDEMMRRVREINSHASESLDRFGIIKKTR